MIYQKKLSRGEIEKIQCYVTPGLRLQGIAAVKQTTGADIVINAALFDMKKNPTAIYSPFIANGKKYGNYSAWGLAFDGDEFYWD